MKRVSDYYPGNSFILFQFVKQNERKYILMEGLLLFQICFYFINGAEKPADFCNFDRSKTMICLITVLINVQLML